VSHPTLIHTPVGGPIMTRTFKVLAGIASIGVLTVLWRFFAGIGAVSNLSDGYPWGVWIAIDVVVGTALGCGGFAIALLVYIQGNLLVWEYGLFDGSDIDWDRN